MNQSTLRQHAVFKVTSEKVTLSLRSTIKQEMQTLTRQDILIALEDLSVVHGINTAAIDELLSKKSYDKEQVIAVAKPVVHGQDAYLEEVIKVDPTIKPKLRGNGAVDFKNIENLPQAHRDDVILLKHPRIQPQDGIDVLGKIITGKPSVDEVIISGGDNTRVSADGLKLYADKTGFLYRNEAGLVCIGIAYEIQGDVNVKTGNIHYLGDVHITGDVVDDFTVEAGGNIVIDGAVGACQIIAGGNIEVAQGVFGRGVARLSAKKNITLPMCREATIECGRTLHVARGLNNCTVTANEVVASTNHCIVSGCQITAYRQVDIAIAGSDLSTLQIRIVDRNTEAYEKKIADLQHQIAVCEDQMTAIQTRLMAIRVKYGKSTDRNIEYDKEKLNKDLDKIRLELTAAKAERTKLVSEYIRPCAFPGKAIIREKIHEGVLLDMYRVEQELAALDIQKQISWCKIDGPEDDESRKQTIPKGRLVIEPLQESAAAG